MNSKNQLRRGPSGDMCDGRCLDDPLTFGDFPCCTCPGRIPTPTATEQAVAEFLEKDRRNRIKALCLLVCVLLYWAIVFVWVPMLAEHHKSPGENSDLLPETEHLRDLGSAVVHWKTVTNYTETDPIFTNWSTNMPTNIVYELGSAAYPWKTVKLGDRRFMCVDGKLVRQSDEQ